MKERERLNEKMKKRETDRKKRETERKKETNRQKERKRERKKETDRQTDRKKERKRERKKERERERRGRLLSSSFREFLPSKLDQLDLQKKDRMKPDHFFQSDTSPRRGGGGLIVKVKVCFFAKTDVSSRQLWPF